MKAQVSVEFFLLVGMMLGLMSVLFPIANKAINDVRSIDDAIIAKSAANSIASAANYVKLSGPGARLSASLFVPQNFQCMQSNATIRCVQTQAYENYSVSVSSLPLYSPLFCAGTCNVSDACFFSGSFGANVSNRNGAVEVRCG